MCSCTLMIIRMQKITKVHMDTMGQTGAGISHEDQIDMSLNNELTTKWGMSHGASRSRVILTICASYHKAIMPVDKHTSTLCI